MPSSKAVPAPPNLDGMAWPAFLDYFNSEYRPGEHGTLIGPTGRGKTTVLVQLAANRPRVMLMDPKGGDRTLRRAGYDVTETWPPRNHRARGWGDAWHGREGSPPKPMRYIFSPKVQTMNDFHDSAVLYSRALQQVFTERDWFVGIDEGKLAATVMRLNAEMLTLAIAARDKGTSLFTALQRPGGVGVPREILDQSSWLFAWPVRDRDTQDRVSEVIGEDRLVVRSILESLGFHDVLVMHVPADRMIITRPAPV